MRFARMAREIAVVAVVAVVAAEAGCGQNRRRPAEMENRRRVDRMMDGLEPKLGLVEQAREPVCASLIEPLVVVIEEDEPGQPGDGTA